LAGWFSAALKAPQVEAKLLELGLYPALLCGKDFGDFIGKRHDDDEAIIRAVTIKVE
jgi:hypothetical protein